MFFRICVVQMGLHFYGGSFLYGITDQANAKNNSNRIDYNNIIK